MSGFMERWILGVACVSMIMVISGLLVKDGSGKRVCKLAGSLLLIMVTMGPILRISKQEWAEMVQWDSMGLEEATEALAKQNNFLYERIIEEQTRTYILDKAASMNVTCQVEVVVKWENDIPQPWSARIRGKCNQGEREVLSEVMQKELGIPQERQTFEVMGA